MKNTRKMFIKSYGCQMNAYDSDRMADVLYEENYRPSEHIEEADLIVLNTCHIRERSSEKVFSELGKIRVLKEQRAKLGLTTQIVVAGCVAQAEGSEILRRQKSVDVVVGPQSYHRLPQLLKQSRDGEHIVDTDFPYEDKFGFLRLPRATTVNARGPSAFVTIQEGCDKFCTFCVVPYTRGAEFSRPVATILSEVRHLVAEGVREITLLGQNVNAYRGKKGDRLCSLAELLYELAELPYLLRLRYMTSHPNDMSEDLIEAHGSLAKLMPYLHLPLQSGSDRILAAMNRNHDFKSYRDLIGRIRQKCPAIALSSDFIVGFPGESDKDFEETLAAAQEIGFASSYFFKYSARPGTTAATSGDHLSESIKSERLARLEAVLEGQRHDFNRAMIGKIVDVLFEKRGKHTGQLVGKTPFLQPILVDTSVEALGHVKKVLVTHVEGNCLFGRLS